VEVGCEIERRPKALDGRHRSAAAISKAVVKTCASALVREERSQEGAQHLAG